MHVHYRDIVGGVELLVCRAHQLLHRTVRASVHLDRQRGAAWAPTVAACAPTVAAGIGAVEAWAPTVTAGIVDKRLQVGGGG